MEMSEGSGSEGEEEEDLRAMMQGMRAEAAEAEAEAVASFMAMAAAAAEGSSEEEQEQGQGQEAEGDGAGRRKAAGAAAARDRDWARRVRGWVRVGACHAISSGFVAHERQPDEAPDGNARAPLPSPVLYTDAQTRRRVVPKEYMDRLVMNYLVIEGYKEVAESLRDEAGVERRCIPSLSLFPSLSFSLSPKAHINTQGTI